MSPNTLERAYVTSFAVRHANMYDEKATLIASNDIYIVMRAFNYVSSNVIIAFSAEIVLCSTTARQENK